MSEPQQPPVPPTAQPQHPASPAPPAPPSAAPLPANPQYPTAPAQFPAQQAQFPGQQAQFPAQQPPYAAAQPGYASASQYPYGQQQYTSAGTGAAGAGNPLARVALIVAVATLAVGLLISLTTPFILRSVEFSSAMFGLVNGIGALIALGGSATALVLGIIAARRPGQHLLVGIAIGIGGAQIASVLISWFSSLFYGLL